MRTPFGLAVAATLAATLLASSPARGAASAPRPAPDGADADPRTWTAGQRPGAAAAGTANPGAPRRSPPGPLARRGACAGCGVVASIRRSRLETEARWVDPAAARHAEGSKPAKNRAASAGAHGASPDTAPSARAGTDRSNQAGRDGEVGPRRRTVYEVVIRLENGETRRLHYEHRPALSVGDRVEIWKGQVYLR